MNIFYIIKVKIMCSLKDYIGVFKYVDYEAQIVYDT